MGALEEGSVPSSREHVFGGPVWLNRGYPQALATVKGVAQKEIYSGMRDLFPYEQISHSPCHFCALQVYEPFSSVTKKGAVQVRMVAIGVW